MTAMLRNPATGELEEFLGFDRAGEPVFHGTNGGFNLHVIQRTPPCAPCKDAGRAEAYRGAGRDQPRGPPAGVPGPRGR